VRKTTLEDALAYIGEDELVDVTPESIRLRKKVLGVLRAGRLRRLIRIRRAPGDVGRRLWIPILFPGY
jgi:hypothetical protein